MSRLNITIGDVYGRLEIINEVDKERRNKRLYRCFHCKCSCGKSGIYKLVNLRSGSTQSCGCLAAEGVKKRSFRHGMSNTRTYITWSHMIQRCTNRNDAWHQKYYGDVKVCERWMKFDNFLSDMGVRPDGMTLDRIDPFGDYKKDNCRWATILEQAHNKRKKPTNGLSAI